MSSLATRLMPARVPSPSPASPMTNAKQKKVIKKILDWSLKQFCGTGDVEKEDAVHAVDYLEQTYGPNPGILKETLEAFKRRLEVLDPAWCFSRIPVATIVPAFDGDQPETARLSVTQLGFLESSSIKGRSKMINVFERIPNFFEKPYNSP